MKATLLRTYGLHQTTGIFHMFDDDELVFKCHMLEPPNINNEPFISCIPEGVYEVEKSISPTYGNCFHILNVPGRTDILQHNGNYLTDTLGCQLIGLNLVDINKDGLVDVTDSVRTRKELEALTNKYTLTISS